MAEFWLQGATKWHKDDINFKKVVKKTYSVNKILQPSIALSSSACRLLYPVSPPTLSTVKTNGAPCDRGLCRDGKPCGLSLLHYRSRFPVLTSELRMHVREQLADTLHHVRKPITCTTKTAAQYCSAEIKTNRHTLTLCGLWHRLYLLNTCKYYTEKSPLLDSQILWHQTAKKRGGGEYLKKPIHRTLKILLQKLK